MMRKLFLVFMLVCSAACSQKKTGEKISPVFETGKKLAEATDKQLWEASGLASSANNPGMLWTLNDSGNGAEVFLIDEELNIRLTCRLKGMVNRDWEDIALGPGPEAGKNYLYIAEIGDNMAIFQYKHIYRFEEPTASKQTLLTIEKFDAITFQLPDRKKDMEALMINPLTKNLYVVSKREEPVYLYELKYPHLTTDTLTATRLISLPLTQIVAADFSPSGQELLMKNYENVYYWNIGTSNLLDALKENPLMVQYEQEPQGESITFSRDGSGFYTISEHVKGKKSYLYFYPRK
jgi:hypothetical protein